MENDKEKVNDVIEQGVSNCCSANVVNGVCMDCQEPCETVIETEQD